GGVVRVAEAERHFARDDEPLDLSVRAGDAGLVPLEILEERAALVFSPNGKQRCDVHGGGAEERVGERSLTLPAWRREISHRVRHLGGRNLLLVDEQDTRST